MAGRSLRGPYVKALLDHCEFDTIYHEHLCYFSLTALSHCFARHGLYVAEVVRISLHGGSLQIHLTPDRSVVPHPSVAAMLAEEQAWGVNTFEPYQAVGKRASDLRVELRRQLRQMKQTGAPHRGLWGFSQRLDLT